MSDARHGILKHYTQPHSIVVFIVPIRLNSPNYNNEMQRIMLCRVL